MARYRNINIDLNRQYRNDLNWNFQQIEDDITESGSNADVIRDQLIEAIDELEEDLNEKIDLLSGESLEELLQSIEDAKKNANDAASSAKSRGEDAEEQGEYAEEQGDYAKEQGDYAKEKGDYADEKAGKADEAAADAINATGDLDSIKADAIDATQDANKAADDTKYAIEDAKKQTDYAEEKGDYAKEQAGRAKKLVDNFEHKGEYSSSTSYEIGNVVSYEGSSYMAIDETEGNTPADKDYWKLVAKKGDVGEGLSIKDELDSNDDLPSEGEVGDGYLIDGNLYVWTGDEWKDVGDIKGPKGDPGTTEWDDIEDKPSKFKPENHTHDIEDVDELNNKLNDINKHMDDDYIHFTKDDIKKSDIGLSKVTNDKQAKKSDFDSHVSAFDSHVDDSDIHFKKSDVSKSDVGLSNVTNDRQAKKSDFDDHVSDYDSHVDDSDIHRKITVSSSEPSSPSENDIWIEVD